MVVWSRPYQTIAMTAQPSKIVYTLTDEAPALATYSFLPIVEAFTKTANVTIETSDISLAGRIYSRTFSDRLPPSPTTARCSRYSWANWRKRQKRILSNCRISVHRSPQLMVAIVELQGQGYDLPRLSSARHRMIAEAEIKARYGKVLGSAVNPVLREGNSDRRVAGGGEKICPKASRISVGAWAD